MKIKCQIIAIISQSLLYKIIIIIIMTVVVEIIEEVGVKVEVGVKYIE